MAKISALHPAVLAAVQGLGIDTGRAARVVIDIKADHAVEVHVIGFGDERLAARLGDILDGAVIVSDTTAPATDPEPNHSEGG
jgi:hypothetical protein